MRIVIKIGTSTITHPTGRLNIRQMEALCKVLSDLKNAGNEVILVSSGAIGMGVGKLRLGKKPVDVPTKQASAAVGQCELMYTYDKLFSEYRHTVAQILLTADDIADPARHENFQNTIQRLLELDAIPIINENDTVSVAEFGIGDNDTLSAIVATSPRHRAAGVIAAEQSGKFILNKVLNYANGAAAHCLVQRLQIYILLSAEQLCKPAYGGLGGGLYRGLHLLDRLLQLSAPSILDRPVGLGAACAAGHREV